MNNAISCRNLHKEYRTRAGSVPALCGLDLQVESAECFGLLGPNGAGKTTTVEILEGLLDPTSGEIRILGHCWGQGQDAELRQRIGMTLQETRFQEKLTVLEIVRLFRSFYHQGLEPAEVLDLVSLGEKSSAWVRELSGGQRQRLAVATGLVGLPELLFLDEPTTGLDPQARRQLWDVVESLKTRGTSILLTTHYMDEAERLCDRVAVIDKGRVIALGTPRQLIRELGGQEVVEFELDQELSPQQLEECPVRQDGLDSIRSEGEHYTLTVDEVHRSIPALLSWLETEGRHLARLTTRRANLEDVFVQLTGRHLRDS